MFELQEKQIAKVEAQLRQAAYTNHNHPETAKATSKKFSFIRNYKIHKTQGSSVICHSKDSLKAHRMQRHEKEIFNG